MPCCTDIQWFKYRVMNIGMPMCKNTCKSLIKYHANLPKYLIGAIAYLDIRVPRIGLHEL